MSNERRPSRMAPVFGGAALAVLMIGLAVGQAETISRCQHCQSYWGYRAANDADKCLRYPFKSYTDHRGTCIQRWIDENCKEICKNDVYLVGTVTCNGTFEQETCPNNLEANGVCQETAWNRSCDSSDGAKRCVQMQTKKTVVGPSVCNTKCVCQ